MEEYKFETANLEEESKLLSVIEDFKKNLETFEMDYYGDPKVLYEGRFKLHEELIEKLISMKESFSHIFRTENGSIYFTTHNGKTVRVKRNKYDYELYPLSDEIIFYDDDGRMVDGPIIGASPFERFTTGEYKSKPAYHRGHDITEVIK